MPDITSHDFATSPQMDVYVPHDGQSHPHFEDGVVLRVMLRNGSCNTITRPNTAYGAEPDYGGGGTYRDWWVWPPDSDAWFDVVGYSVLS